MTIRHSQELAGETPTVISQIDHRKRKIKVHTPLLSSGIATACFLNGERRDYFLQEDGL